MNDFLIAYYKQLHFNDMPAAVRAQFDTYAKSDDFRGNMKDWKSDLMTNGASNTLPDPGAAGGAFELSPEEWTKLFKTFQNAFRSMDADRKSFSENKAANELLDEYFGSDKLFSIATADSRLRGDITALQNVLRAHAGTLSKWFQDNGKLFENIGEYNDFVKDLTNTPAPGQPKYNTDAKFQKKLKSVADWLSYATTNNLFETYGGNLKSDLMGVLNQTENIKDGFEEATVLPAKMDVFKYSYGTLLNDLYKKPKILDVFKEHDEGKISKQLAKALEKTDYNNKDSKDFIPPKRPDELTLGQQLSDWCKDTYEDSLEKFVKLRGDRMFVSPEAKTIVKALDSAKIKPTDGLAKVLDEASKIKDKLKYKSPKAAEAFEYFEKIMGELKTTMPKAFAGALHNGRQMRALVEQMVLSAVENGKTKEAKIAMEILSVIKYGYTTSKIMDAIGKEKMTIFSDPGLSWNKTEGVKFVTTAFDKSLKAAFMGVGYGITIVGNAINLSGNKFNGKPHGIANARNAILSQNEQERQNLTVQQTADQNRLNTVNANLARARTAGIDENTPRDPNKLSDKIAILDANIELNGQISQLDTWLQNPVNLGSPDFQEKTNERDHWKNQLDTIKANQDASIVAMQTWINDPANATNPDMQNVRQTLARTMNERQLLNLDLATATAERARMDTDLTQHQTKLDDFHNGIAETQLLTGQITAREEKLNTWDDKHKDQYLELMAHWDFLETGSNVKSWGLSKKNAQKKFDTLKDAKMTAWRNDYQSQYTP